MVKIRRVLALPFVPLQIVAGLLGAAMMWLGHQYSRMCAGYRKHVYMGIVITRRWIAGIPTWQPVDLFKLDVQPRTKRQVAHAETCSEVQRVVCDCGDPECPVARAAAKGQAIFMPAAAQLPFDPKDLQVRIDEALRQSMREANVPEYARKTPDQVREDLKTE